MNNYDKRKSTFHEIKVLENFTEDTGALQPDNILLVIRCQECQKGIENLGLK